MQHNSSTYLRSLIFALAGTFAAGSVLAEKPAWAGGGDKGSKGQKHEREGRDDAPRGKDKDRDRAESRDSRDKGESAHRFKDEHRVAVREYYGGEPKAGRCPPGLAKKNNGCMPPGQAKKWTVGRTLPRDVIFYEVPGPLVVQLGVPAPGYRYVRVAGDILLIAIGTAIVIDAIQDLGR